jgi:hypothetical protein
LNEGRHNLSQGGGSSFNPASRSQDPSTEDFVIQSGNGGLVYGFNKPTSSALSADNQAVMSETPRGKGKKKKSPRGRKKSPSGNKKKGSSKKQYSQSPERPSESRAFEELKELVAIEIDRLLEMDGYEIVFAQTQELARSVANKMDEMVASGFPQEMVGPFVAAVEDDLVKVLELSMGGGSSGVGMGMGSSDSSGSEGVGAVRGFKMGKIMKNVGGMKAKAKHMH